MGRILPQVRSSASEPGSPGVAMPARQRMRLRRRRAPGAVRARDDLEKMPVRILEVDAAPAVPVVRPAGLLAKRVGPVRELACPNPPEDLVELGLADQKGVVLRVEPLVL